MNYKQMLEEFTRLNDTLKRLNERIEVLEQQNKQISPPSWCAILALTVLVGIVLIF